MLIQDLKEGYSALAGEELYIRVKPASYHETVKCIITSVKDALFSDTIDVTDKVGDYYYLQYSTTDLEEGTYLFSFWGFNATQGMSEIGKVWVAISEHIKRS